MSIENACENPIHEIAAQKFPKYFSAYGKIFVGNKYVRAIK